MSSFLGKIDKREKRGYNRDMKQILIVIALLGVSACAAPSKGPLVGNDRDVHGCIGSAGYSWSETLQQCVRPWEVDK